MCLVLGLFTRLAGVLGALLMLTFGLAWRAWFLTPSQPHWLLMVVLLSLALLGAGRIWGIDARLHGRIPRWIS